jgi:hypothetical protein
MDAAKSMVMAVSAVLLLQQPAAAQDRDRSEEVIGWIWRCSVEFKNELGSFSGNRNLNDDGSRAEPDSANWYAPVNGQFGFSVSANWSMPWSFSMPGDGVLPLSQVPATLSFALGSERGMPKQAVLRFKRAKGYNMAIGLTLPFDRGATKRFANTRTTRDDILAFGSGRDALFWTVEETSKKGWHPIPFAEGTLDLKALRAVQNQLPEITSRLDAKATNYRNECTRVQIKNNPKAEI